MAVFPRIDSPCPYKSRLATVMDGDFCRMCRRTVFDLSAMTDEGRLAFLSGCSEEVCVSYKLPLRPALAAAAMAAALTLPAAAAAQEADVAMEIEAEIGLDVEEMTIFVGGIKAPSSAVTVELPDEAAAPDLPVIYEDEGDSAPAGEGDSLSGAAPSSPAGA